MWYLETYLAMLTHCYLCVRTLYFVTPDARDPLSAIYGPRICSIDFGGECGALCKKPSNHRANLPLEMYSFTL